MFIYSNTLRLWPKLSRSVRLVVYLDEVDCSNWMVVFIKELGWEVRQVPYSHPVIPIPVLRNMFMETIDSYNSTFYMYANGDMLFDHSLIETVEAIIPSTGMYKRILLVGKRLNYIMNGKEHIENLEELKRKSRNATYFTEWAMDYFITTRDGFNWKGDVPDFVVGRIRYDNWILSHALTTGVVAIDTTKTILAFHQTGTGGIRESLNVPYVNLNADLAGDFNLNIARINCSPMKTRFSSGAASVVIEHHLNRYCRRAFYRKRLKPASFRERL